MAFYIPRGLGSRFTTLQQSFAQGDGQPFASALTDEQIQQAAVAEGVTFGAGDDCIFTPLVTLWAWVLQAASGSGSCVAAVARVIVLRVAMDLDPCAAATGAYCKARQKLPEGFLSRLTYEVGAAVEDQAPASWRWHDRRTLLVDGVETVADDTLANQAAYPQPTTQRRGLGFPMIRFVVLLTFATATVVGAAIGPYSGKETGETALFRQLFEQLRAGDIIVTDRYYCSYFMIALLKQRGVDAACRLHHKRKYDFRRGQRLGRDDHIVVWQRPSRPTWMDAATYASMPATINVREVRLHIDEPGCRSSSIIVATTLLDNKSYRAADIADLYHQRWHVELDIRSIKQTLKIEWIHCKTPEMVRKALWTHLLAYNLIRKVAAQAAWERQLTPRQISFAGAQQTLDAFRWALICSEAGAYAQICKIVLVAVATHRVADRPNRVEPRLLKRRYDIYGNLREPRAQTRAAILNGQE